MMELCFVLLFGLIWSCGSDTPETYLLKTQSLPTDRNFMPSLSNGHLGYTVFGDAIFMNGVYNGAAGNSKRARIPNWINITAELCDRLSCQINNEATDISYEMDLRGGFFRHSRSFVSMGLTLEQRTYPHRYYNRALVYELLAFRHPTVPLNLEPQYLKLTQQPGNASSDFDFEVLSNGSNAAGDYRLMRGRTKVLEHKQFQPHPHEIYVLFSEAMEQPLKLDWPTGQRELQHRVIISIDRQQSVALKELQDALQLSPGTLMQSHIQVWTDFWEKQFSIELTGNALELSRIVNAGIFYLASSLPTLSSNQVNEPYFGLSPTGLARGNLEADYEGHNFWDTEIWMLPVITQFGFEYAKQLLGYRYNHLEGARYNAQMMGNKGARFPWESAYTGTEVINPCCPEIAQQEIHISPDISFALQKFFAQSNNYTWLCEQAWFIAAEVAEFLDSRSTCTQAPKTCHFLNVMGPDEDHGSVDDNVYTNAVAKIALDFAIWTGGRCGNSSTYLIENWRNLRDNLVILRDEDLDYHPQHLGYKLNETVKQADTILLGYPLQFDTSSTHLNDLHYYAKVTRTNGPAMTWSMFAANYLSTTEDGRAHDFFARGYQSYVHNEFKVWSEVPIGYKGSANFLTGIGGFLQALIFGYGGLNFARVADTSQMQLTLPNVPPQVDQVLVKYIRFAQGKCSWNFQYNSSNMICTSPVDQVFELIQGRQRRLLGNNFNVTLNRGDPTMYINVLNSGTRK
ncbi:protein-glucosylgalactosylhydroxylysine glucosidase [Drosophila novamexicana]|uniref:protein-glucosylgalactosylhydroxylysine glucosidase n=1 Tax=Drosophila novamexicana TaxID=47314 RepID=UPI0011E60630|nr:protein-glucosylgalactosylhydroxylysine glucosidase [Drosophila novamexicana]